MAEYPFRPSPPKSDAEYRNEAEMKLLGTEPLETYLRRELPKMLADDVMTEHEYLTGESPHPAVVDHTAAVVERVQALKPPSLVKLDRAEALVAAVVIWRNRELHGQAPGEEQYDSALDYIRDLTDRYIEETP